MNGLTVTCWVAVEYLQAAWPTTTLAFPHLKTVDQNTSLQAELLDLMSISYIKKNWY